MIRAAPAFLFITLAGLATILPAGAVAGSFIENRGQVNSRVLFYTFGAAAGIYLTSDAVVFDLREDGEIPRERGPRNPRGYDVLSSERAADLDSQDQKDEGSRQGCAVWARFRGARPTAPVEGHGELAGKYHFFLGDDPAQWRTGVPAYEEIVYQELWSGVDLTFRIREGKLVCEVGSDESSMAEDVSFDYEGADRVVHQTNGTVWVETAVGSLVETKEGMPDQGEIAWERSQLQNTQVDQQLKDNPSALLWSTFLGGSNVDDGRGLVLDSSDSPVVTGSTGSVDFPTSPGAYDESHNLDRDVFVVKLSSDGSDLIWGTFIGGSSLETGQRMALDPLDNPVVTGTTRSADFPTTPGAYDDTYNDGPSDAFVAKLSADGSDLLWSTFLGGTEPEAGLGVGLDPEDNSVVTGWTESADFPTTPGAYDETFNGYPDVYVAKLSADGSELLWSTFLGGMLDWDQPWGGVVLDPSGNPVVTGETWSLDFPVTPGAYDVSYNDGPGDVFVSKISSDGSSLLWSTFLGGSLGDNGQACVLDPFGNPVVTGWAHSSDFPTTSGVYDESHNGYHDAFVTKMSSDGSTLLWSTLLGGGVDDFGRDIEIDSSGNMVVVGTTKSSNFPTTPDAYDEFFGGIEKDVFVSKLSFDGSDLLWSSFLGGSGIEECGGVTLDPLGNAVITGWTEFPYEFPTTRGAYDTSPNGSQDGFVSKFRLDQSSGVSTPQGYSTTAALEIHNNPSAGRHVVQLVLARETRARIGVYDALGRQVRLLMSGQLQKGSYRLLWDGRDDTGRNVPSGVYWAKAVVAGQTRGRPLVVVR